MMDDGMLSQSEIDALLNVTDDQDEDVTSDVDEDVAESAEIKVSDYLSDIEVDTLGEIGNITFGSSATTLSTLLTQKVDITTPEVSIVRKGEITSKLSSGYVGIQVNYVEGFIGENIFVIKAEDAAIISDIMLGGDGTNPDMSLDDIHLSAVQEAMNQMMGAAATSMSALFNTLVNISPPTIESEESDVAGETIEGPAEEEVFVKVSFQLKVGELIDSSIMQLIPIPFANELVDELLNPTPEVNESEEVTTEQQIAVEEVAAVAEVEQPVKQPVKQPVSQPVANGQTAPQYIGDPIDQNNASIQPATFSNFEPVELNQNEQRNLDMLLDIPLKVTVELGRTNRTIKDILDLSSGSIIELDKLAGEPVDILVNEKLIAQGEVVVIDENFGVRVTDIISQTERLMKLN